MEENDLLAEKKAEVLNRKEGVRKWLDDKYNLWAIGIVLLAFIIRIYYFVVTKGQTLWWDEAEYMSTAKLWALGIPFEMNPQRPPLFQFLASIGFRLGLGEEVIKFFLVLVPGVVLVFVVYLLGKEMFNRQIGLMAAFLTSISWTLLFWGTRVQPDFLSMSFQVLAILFMWKFWKQGGNKMIILAGVFAALGFYFKVSGLLVPIAFAVFILIKDRLEAFKKKEYYYFSGVFLLMLVPYFIWSQITFGTATAFRTGYSAGVAEKIPFAWENLNLFFDLTGILLFVLFLAGAVMALKFFLYFDVLIKEKKKVFDAGLFSILMLVVVASFYIFYIRAWQDRWVFLWLPFIFFFVGGSLEFIYDSLKKYGKLIALVVVIGLLLWGSYWQYNQADNLIKVKVESYKPVELAGIWMKENSERGDIILSMSRTQNTYYSERFTYKKFEDGEPAGLDAYIFENEPKFLSVSIFEPNPSWLQKWIAQNEGRLEVVQAYWADASQQQVVLVVYEIKY